MDTQSKQSLNPFGEGQDKYNDFNAQKKRVFKALYGTPKTMLMVSVETGILRANICRYVSKWEDKKRIALVNYGICRISKHRAGFYTTRPDLFPKSNQTKQG